MQLLGRAKLKGGRKSLRKGEVLKGGANFLKGEKFLGFSPPGGKNVGGAKILVHRNIINITVYITIYNTLLCN
jgi:hypothetical protein